MSTSKQNPVTKWMVGIGLSHLLVMLLCFAGGAAAAISSARHGGDWQGIGYIVGIIAAIVGVWFLAFGVVLLLARPGVQRGYRRATGLCIGAASLAGLLPVPIMLYAGQIQDTRAILVMVAPLVWLALHIRLIALLIRARKSPAISTPI